MKTLYIIAGCNGAGKTTATYTVLPEVLDCKEFVNADEIARGLSPLQPETVGLEAGRIMLKRIHALLEEGASFAFETTLSTRSYVSLLRKAKQLGYRINLLFFWLPSADMAVQRVKWRVSEGGHNIPEEVIRRRYSRGLKNFFELYSTKVDNWLVFENSGDPYRLIAEGSSQSLNIEDSAVWHSIKKETDGQE